MELGEPNRLRMERTMSPTFICKAQLAHMKTSVHILELVQCTYLAFYNSYTSELFAVLYITELKWSEYQKQPTQ